MPPSETFIETLRARVCAGSTSSREAEAAAEHVIRSGGDAVLAVVFFGSRKTQAGADSFSAYDFFVATRDYRSFYSALKARGDLRRPVGFLAALNLWLPPSVISVTADRAEGPLRAKCAVLTLDRLRRETSWRRKDHFCLGRLFQATEVLYAADDSSREQIIEALASAHWLTYRWIRPWLPETFTVEAYARTLLRLSLSREIRPEPAGRADALWSAQETYLRPVYSQLLAELAQAGELVRSGDVFALARRVTVGERLRLAAYFRWSLVRATARWIKYVLTFEDWLEYVVRKASRHTGETFVLTPLERRWPLLFLWPRVIRYLRGKDRPSQRSEVLSSRSEGSPPKR